jgi:hypothetical protein
MAGTEECKECRRQLYVSMSRKVMQGVWRQCYVSMAGRRRVQVWRQGVYVSMQAEE